MEGLFFNNKAPFISNTEARLPEGKRACEFQ